MHGRGSLETTAGEVYRFSEAEIIGACKVIGIACGLPPHSAESLWLSDCPSRKLPEAEPQEKKLKSRAGKAEPFRTVLRQAARNDRTGPSHYRKENENKRESESLSAAPFNAIKIHSQRFSLKYLPAPASDTRPMIIFSPFN